MEVKIGQRSVVNCQKFKKLPKTEKLWAFQNDTERPFEGARKRTISYSRSAVMKVDPNSH